MSNYAKCKWCGTEFRKGAMKRFISKNTAGIAGREKYCSEKCKREAEAAKSGDSAPQVHAAAAHGGGGGTTIINKESGFGALVKSMGSVATTTKEELDDDYRREKEEKEALEAKIENVAAIEFSKEPEDIQNQLNKLISIAASRPERKVRRVIIEKMEFGIMKLTASGAGPEVTFFQEKLDKFKKKGRL